MAIALLGFFVYAGSTYAAAQNLGLISLLTKNLGVTQEQATGGAGAIFDLAKQKLGVEDFSKIANVVPGMDSLLKAAPQTSGLSKAIGGKTALMGGGADKIGGLTSLTNSFSQLGLKPDMIGKYSDTIVSYVKSKGGSSLSNILAGVLK
ncbi:MAG: DUF2780 domain-containing protein [Deltaproteobacteria bacterium]|nr:DUF2780 domain-containing protein [Deltaproteobacteria bacterium]